MSLNADTPQKWPYARDQAIAYISQDDRQLTLTHSLFKCDNQYDEITVRPGTFSVGVCLRHQTQRHGPRGKGHVGGLFSLLLHSMLTATINWSVHQPNLEILDRQRADATNGSGDRWVKKT